MKNGASDARGSILGAAIGDCVHVAGVYNFLRLAEEQGYRTVFLGPAVPVKKLLEAVRVHRPGLVGVSYRLTPAAAEPLLQELAAEVEELRARGVRFVFGGTPPVCRVAERVGLFERVFDGTEGDEAVIAYLRGGPTRQSRERYARTLVERIQAQAPYPLLRHHFGLPSLEETIRGVRELAEAKVLDVISLGPDQNAQESFFRPGEMDPTQDGAGGVPVRSADDFRALYEAAQCGNYPLLRSYSGTRDLIPMAELLVETIHLAWGAIPLFWYNVLDGRSQRPLLESIQEAQAAMAWHARRGIPVEVNEAHHWSLRDAPDEVTVAAGFLAAYNARRAGVRDYVAQFMFNSPPGTSFRMDLAKMLAQWDLISSLGGPEFRIWRQTRTGLASLPPDLDVAKGQLASSTFLQMALRPHIVHVVAHCEADHAARPRDIIEAVKIARGTIRNCLHGMPDLTADPAVQERREELKAEVWCLLEAIRQLAPEEVEDPWADPATLERAVRLGLLDAPHLKGNPYACGRVVTRLVDGACRAVDPETGRVLPGRQRVARLLRQGVRAAS